MHFLIMEMVLNLDSGWLLYIPRPRNNEKGAWNKASLVAANDVADFAASDICIYL